MARQSGADSVATALQRAGQVSTAALLDLVQRGTLS